MTALSEALVAAQRSAVHAMGKAYIAERLDGDGLRERFRMIGLTDVVDADSLIAAWDVIREHGGPLPSAAAAAPGNGAAVEPQPATQAQRDRIKRDLVPLHGDDAAISISSEPTLTKAQASEIIDSIAKGRFELNKWAVPF